MNTPHCTPEQLDLLRHMLGINDPSQRVPTPYRDYAAVCPGDPSYIEMAQAGLVEIYREAAGANPNDYYCCTAAGREAALASHKAIRWPKARRVYRKYLDVSDVLTGLTFSQFLRDPQFADLRKDA